MLQLQLQLRAESDGDDLRPLKSTWEAGTGGDFGSVALYMVDQELECRGGHTMPLGHPSCWKCRGGMRQPLEVAVDGL